MSLIELVLQTKQAKKAIGRGVITLIFSGDVNKAWNEMINEGRKNGAYPALKVAIVFDFLKLFFGKDEN